MRLADIDGSGTADLVYLGAAGARSGSTSRATAGPPDRSSTQFPRSTPTSQASVFDLLGTGTACLVWTSPLPGDARRRCATST